MNKKGELGTVMDRAQGTLLEAIHNEMKVKKLLISNSDTADDTQGEVTVQKSVSLKASQDTKCSQLLILCAALTRSADYHLDSKFRKTKG